jgi:rubrerythrin
MSAIKGIDFARLSLRDALDLGVLIEEEARDRYEEFADQMELHHTPEAAQFFRFMSANEEKHRAKLAARRAGECGDEPVRVTRSMIFDVEAPEYDEARASMSVRAALASALRSEEKAHAFFVAALPAIVDPQVRALFEELRDEEVEHQRLVRGELEKAPAEPELPNDAWEDEPVAQ